MLLRNTTADLQRTRPVPGGNGLPIPFACVNGSCGGECSPGSRRCNPGNGVPQFCSSNGIWQSQAPCPFVCSGSGSCGGECAPGSRRCSPVSGVPQLCSEAGSWQNQAACPFVCSSGVCGGECSPGSRRCDPASGVPQLCSNGGTWQNQQGCARGCQGGSCTPQLGLGATCGSTTDCLSGFCVDGVCCESACGGVCAQCQPGTGACVAPATDQACSPVICESNDCQISSGNIVSNLCRSRGQCKNQSDCNFAQLDQGTPCDTENSNIRFCDGAGSCVDPTVRCNGVSGRPIGDNICCVRREGGTITESYEPRTACGGLLTETDIACDADEDCRSGTVCCVTGASGGSEVTCLPTTTCNTSSSFVSYRELCASPSGFSDSCPANRTCGALANFLTPGWRECLP